MGSGAPPRLIYGGIYAFSHGGHSLCENGEYVAELGAVPLPGRTWDPEVTAGKLGELPLEVAWDGERSPAAVFYARVLAPRLLSDEEEETSQSSSYTLGSQASQSIQEEDASDTDESDYSDEDEIDLEEEYPSDEDPSEGSDSDPSWHPSDSDESDYSESDEDEATPGSQASRSSRVSPSTQQSSGLTPTPSFSRPRTRAPPRPPAPAPVRGRASAPPRPPAPVQQSTKDKGPHRPTRPVLRGPAPRRPPPPSSPNTYNKHMMETTPPIKGNNNYNWPWL